MTASGFARLFTDSFDTNRFIFLGFSTVYCYAQDWYKRSSVFIFHREWELQLKSHANSDIHFSQNPRTKFIVKKWHDLKFGLSEKHTKFEKIFLMVLTNQVIYLVNVKSMRKIFFKLCVLLKKSELKRKLQTRDKSFYSIKYGLSIITSNVRQITQ